MGSGEGGVVGLGRGKGPEGPKGVGNRQRAGFPVRKQAIRQLFRFFKKVCFWGVGMGVGAMSWVAVYIGIKSNYHNSMRATAL